VTGLGGAIWDDPDRWRTLLTEAGCPICSGGGPGGVLADRPATWITSEERVPTQGYLCVVAKRHVIEPWELSPFERDAFWADVVFAAERVARLVDAFKMNYEIHGNSIPHLHAHVYPRFRDDRFAGGPIDNRLEYVRNVPLAELRQALL
jgi:diadenosine tetraphosphate (Ap4A) HIT family hydrolase